jgi:hypothetical protein
MVASPAAAVRVVVLTVMEADHQERCELFGPEQQGNTHQQIPAHHKVVGEINELVYSN